MTDTNEGVRSEVVELSNDLLVSTDLMDDVIRDVEKHRVDEAILLRHTAMAVIAKAKETIAALDIHLCDVMEFGDAVNYKGWTFRKGRTKERERFDHAEIGRWVRKAIYDQITSEDNSDFYRGANIGAAEAIRIMSDIYLSDSTKAKTGQLDRYGIPRGKDAEGTVRHWERGDPCIHVGVIQSEVQE